MNHQPIAGTAPSELKEVTVMTIWPSIASTTAGRLIGRLCMVKGGPTLAGIPVRIGWFLAVLCIGPALLLYFITKVPRFPLVLFGVRNARCLNYRLTNRRVVVDHPYSEYEEKSVALDRFDSIEVDVTPGQEWFPSGDLIFRLGETETFRLAAVQRPETFKQTCLKSQRSFVGIQQLREAGCAV